MTPFYTEVWEAIPHAYLQMLSSLSDLLSFHTYAGLLVHSVIPSLKKYFLRTCYVQNTILDVRHTALKV